MTAKTEQIENGNPPPRAGAAALRLVVALALLAVIAYGAYAWQAAKNTGGMADEAVFHKVERKDFEFVVTERGEIESVGDAEIRSQVKSKNTTGLSILRIVPEGADVEEGDFLVELDSSALDEERTLQQIAVNTAEALVVEARNLYETSVIALKEYEEGVFVQEKQTIESEVFIAEEDLSRAQEYLVYSKKLAAKGYVTDLQLEADAFAVENARKTLEAAQTKLRVLEKFTREKMLKQLESDVRISEAKWEAEKNSLRLETGRLEEIEDQIAKCMIVAPRAGTVKYAHISDRRGQDDFIVEEGAVIRERQTIIRLPDTSVMQVEVKINESLVKNVSPGMEAQVRPIGYEDSPLRGRLARINQYAEPSGWRRANVKEYEAYVDILNAPEGIRPGMTASVRIRAMFIPDALQAPVQAVIKGGDGDYCLVKDGQDLTLQRVECGPTNDRFYVIENGLEEADLVVLNPRTFLGRDGLDVPPLQRGSPSSGPPGGRPAEGESGDDATDEGAEESDSGAIAASGVEATASTGG
ncbi:macrolide transporter subunit MacA [Pseudobythopirellula maris]|uniref:Macrolide transporter subunit MacA n=1 Tax=Pseudobythopirellula maris TaxID=2527991 RepID=A0A5C5ZJK0_9BACT|nr:HlyD family efflux transporter periplasmic adaptor subunit [Pseudobythopirellula maris]TWT87350.1 macrolide transporter subunit MacA [Pseudobythopirellula maris]